MNNRTVKNPERSGATKRPVAPPIVPMAAIPVWLPRALKIRFADGQRTTPRTHVDVAQRLRKEGYDATYREVSRWLGCR